MDEPMLGELITNEAKRDAIHIAITPAIAATTLKPGQRVGFVEPGNTELVGVCKDPIGIVDPYLKEAVKPKTRFWLCLFPRTVTSLRHEWTHPDFDMALLERFSDDSRRWIADKAAEIGLTYSAMMDAAEKYVKYGDYTTQLGDESWRDGMIGCYETFWNHYEKITGTKIPDKSEGFFSCSC